MCDIEEAQYKIDFGEELEQRCSFVGTIGGVTRVWKHEDIMRVIDILTENNCVVNGGDFFINRDDIFHSTFDNWVTTQDEEDADYILKSNNEAREHIKEYIEENSDIANSLGIVVLYEKV